MNWHPRKITALYCRVDSGQHSAMSAFYAQNQKNGLFIMLKNVDLRIYKYLVTVAAPA